VAEGVAADQRARIDKPVTFETKRVNASGEEKEVSVIDTIKQWAPLGFAYLLWISVFSTASMLMFFSISTVSVSPTRSMPSRAATSPLGSSVSPAATTLL
jgi:hypothetical protein